MNINEAVSVVLHEAMFELPHAKSNPNTEAGNNAAKTFLKAGAASALGLAAGGATRNMIYGDNSLSSAMHGAGKALSSDLNAIPLVLVGSGIGAKIGTVLRSHAINRAKQKEKQNSK